MVDLALNALFDPPRYFRDAMGSTVSVQTACELRASGDITLRLQVHRPERKGRAPWLRSTENRIAEVLATVGAFAPGRATCFCELWVREKASVDATVDLLLEQLVVGVRAYLGEHEILGAVVESTGGSLPETSLHYRSYSFHANTGIGRHHPVPRVDPEGVSPGWLPCNPAQDADSASREESGPRAID